MRFMVTALVSPARADANRTGIHHPVRHPRTSRTTRLRRLV